MTDTYYDRLGVSPGADQSEIKRAWQEAVKETHPDQNDDPNAQQQFMLVKEAYDVLSDPEERERYDRLGHDQYVAAREHGSGGEETRQAYERDRSAGQSGGQGSRSVDWSANTRGHQAAEHVWTPGQGPTADTAPPTDTADASTGKRAAAYGAVVGIPGVLSVYATAAWTSGMPEYGVQSAGVAAVGITVVAVALTWAAIVGTEWLLDTDRRVWTPV